MQKLHHNYNTTILLLKDYNRNFAIAKKQLYR